MGEVVVVVDFPVDPFLMGLALFDAAPQFPVSVVAVALPPPLPHVPVVVAVAAAEPSPAHRCAFPGFTAAVFLVLAVFFFRAGGSGAGTTVLARRSR